MNGILGGQVKFIDDFTRLMVGIILIVSLSFLLVYFSYSSFPRSSFSAFGPKNEKINESKIDADMQEIKELPLYRI